MVKHDIIRMKREAEKYGGNRMLGLLLNFFRPKWKHSNPKVREKAIKKLGETGKKNAIKILLDTLSDEYESVRNAAVESLNQMGNRVVEPLLQSLNSPDPSIRKATVIALGATNDSRAIKPLFNVLEDDDVGVRKTVIDTLSRIGGSQSVEPIISIMLDNEPFVRKAASDALRILAEKVGDLNLKRLSSAYNRNIKKMFDNLVQNKDSRIVVPIGRVLRKGSWTFRPMAAEALGKLGNLSAVEMLFVGLEDENFDTRLFAVKSLGILGDSRAIEPLTMKLNDTERSVREETAKVLKKLIANQVNTKEAVVKLATGTAKVTEKTDGKDTKAQG